MTRRSQLLVIICTVIAIVAIISHSIIAYLKIETSFGGHWVAGPEGGRHSVFLAGSSLAGDGLFWGEIGNVLDLRIEGWGVAGSSTSEWERFQQRATHAKLTIIVVSPYDLNENFLCDFRAEVVPVGQTIEDLWQSKADWPFIKRLLSIYPLAYIRAIFPTAGRSGGVMVGVREKLYTMLGKNISTEAEAGPSLTFNQTGSAQDGKKEKISNWSQDRLLRRLASMRNGVQGKHVFKGPKQLALERMLHQAQEQGRVVVVVLPVSPAYSKEFLTPAVNREFEAALAEAKREVPQALWIRLDQLDKLNSNEFFWDLVHINSYGQKIATEAFMDQLKKIDGLL
jgi:hypothetical protein